MTNCLFFEISALDPRDGDDPDGRGRGRTAAVRAKRKKSASEFFKIPAETYMKYTGSSARFYALLPARNVEYNTDYSSPFLRRIDHFVAK
jgi:hypothetical protein